MYLLIRPTKRGEHIHVNIYSGRDHDHLALNGSLAFSQMEWEHFIAVTAGQLGPYVVGTDTGDIEVEEMK